MKDFYMLACHGTSVKTGKRVGSRHRWDIGDCCVWCGRFKEDVLVPQKKGKEGASFRSSYPT